MTHPVWSRLEPKVKLRTVADLDRIADDIWRFTLAGLGHPVYDCLYISTAIEFEAALATADARLARAARSVVAEVRLIGG